MRDPGSSLHGGGYGCMMPALVDLWRREWSRVPGTTDPRAPFGVVTLAAGGSEGGSDIAGMRWSQTANYGVLPNAAMPNTFLAQGYDIGDPYPSKTCYSMWCCWGGGRRAASPAEQLVVSADVFQCGDGCCQLWCAAPRKGPRQCIGLGDLGGSSRGTSGRACMRHVR